VTAKNGSEPGAEEWEEHREVRGYDRCKGFTCAPFAGELCTVDGILWMIVLDHAQMQNEDCGSCYEKGAHTVVTKIVLSIEQRRTNTPAPSTNEAPIFLIIGNLVPQRIGSGMTMR